MAQNLSYIEQSLVKITEEVLGIAGVKPDDDFLRLGGDSVTAFRLAIRIEATLGVDCPQILIFDSRSLAELAQALAETLDQGSSQDCAEHSRASGDAAT